MNASTSKIEAMDIYQYLLKKVVPNYEISSAELALQLEGAIYVLQAEVDFTKVFNALELVQAWGNAMHNEAAMNIDAEEANGQKERVSDAAWYMDEIYWEMNESLAIISRQRDLAQTITQSIKEIRETMLKDAAKRVARKARASYPDTIQAFKWWLNPDTAMESGSLTDKILKARAKAYRGEPLWDIGAALTSDNLYIREVMKYRYMLSFGEHFAKHYKSLQK